MQNNFNEIVTFEKVYIKDSNDRLIFKDLSFTINKGEIIFILGHNEKERDLLLLVILGMVNQVSGTVKVFNNNILSLNKIELYNLRKKMGYCHHEGGLLKDLTVLENIILPLQFNSSLKVHEINEKALNLIKNLNIQRHSNENGWEIDNYVEKKTSLARAIINSPDLLLLNEPTLYLEDKDKKDIMNIISVKIKELIKDETTIIITSDNTDFAKILARKILYLNHGKIERFCSSSDYFQT